MSEIVFKVIRVGISINCLKPKLSNKSGAVESSGLGSSIGFLQKTVSKV